MPTEDEMEEITNENIERERRKAAVLHLQLEQMDEAIKKAKAVGNYENVSGLRKGGSGRTGH